MSGSETDIQKSVRAFVVRDQDAAGAQKDGNPVRLPPWIRVKVKRGKHRSDVAEFIDELGLNTVCQSARCPNLAECWHERTATFMVLGDSCTRSCAFCAVKSFSPEPVQLDEPERVAEACVRMDLKFVVVTSVDRDDLPDKGADHFSKTIHRIRRRLPGIGIEVLTPDFKGRRELVAHVMEARPTVFNHNMETCRRLTPIIRSGARYERSLSVLRAAKEFASGAIAIKSGIMLGLGETDAEIEETMSDMKGAGVDIITIGQYMPPTKAHWTLDRYVEPAQFEALGRLAEAMGFKAVASAPLVRSSYRAREMAEAVLSSLAVTKP